MPTDRKVLVLLVPRSEGESAVDILDDMSVEGIRAALRSALDKEATEREEWRAVGVWTTGRFKGLEWWSLPSEDRALAKERTDAARLGSYVRDVREQVRTITTFEDGAEYRSAWVDCEGERG